MNRIALVLVFTVFCFINSQDPANNIIASISPSSVQLNTETEFSFTTGLVAIKGGDKIYLSINDPTADTPSTTLPGSSSTIGTVKGTFTLTAVGSYSAYIERGGQTVKQTASAIQVQATTNGFIISITFALLLTLFLF